MMLFGAKKAGKIDVDDYADTNKKRYKEEFEKDPDFKKGDPDYQETLGAAIKAKAIVELNDALDPSPPVVEVVSFLNATIDLPGGKTFKYDKNGLGADHYRIYFNPTIEPNYTEGIRKDLIGHDGYYTRKKIREMIHKSSPGEYDKHIKAKTIDQAESMSYKNAQYMPKLDVTLLERRALDNGILVKFDEGKNQLWKIFRNETPVGFNQGVQTNWIRVEISSGKFHGHPIKLDGPNGVLDLLKESKAKFPEEIAGSFKEMLGTSTLDKIELKALEKFFE